VEKRPHALPCLSPLTPGGLLFLVLPSACVLNSRFINIPMLTRITEALGLSPLAFPMAVRVTASLWMCVYSRVGSPDSLPSNLRGRKEIRVGPGKFNNFAILLGHRQSLPVATGQETAHRTSSNERRRLRKKKLQQTRKTPEPPVVK